MDMKYFSLLDMAIVGVPVFGIGIWQLVSINREIAKDKAAKTSSDPSPESARHPVGEHRLDDR
jgi:hypothetical protein